MQFHIPLHLLKKIGFAILVILILIQCADDEFLTASQDPMVPTDLNTTASNTLAGDDCLSCAYVVPANNNIIDGAALGLKPGDVIGLNAGIIYSNLIFRNIVGSADNPIVIRNCGGVAQVNATGKPDGIKTQNSKYFRITGGDADQVYGIKVIGGHMGVNLGGLSTDCEVDHIEITNSGFAGIMAKTDPGCNEATWRANFLMENVDLHHNLITDTGGEGIYAGNSFFMGMNTSCGVQLPHEIHNINIYQNIVKNTGWDAIQLGCATKGASIYGNIIENYGVVNQAGQNNGIQIGAGTGGLCYNNLIRKGTGNGLIMMGLGDNIVYNNIIDEAGSYGIFCDERYSPGPGFKFINNTILNPKSDGIRIYAELVPMNVIVNNIISNPGSYSSYAYPRSSSDAFVYKLNNDVKIQMANNYFTQVTESLKMINPSGLDYRLDATSPVIDKGTDIAPYCNISNDFYDKPRLNGSQYDVGAVENVSTTEANAAPVAHGGADMTITLPLNSVTLSGTASDSDGAVVSYRWSQISGGPVTIENANSMKATVKSLAEGQYSFRLTVTDDKGATDDDDVLVTVAAAGNVAPIANAGPDRNLGLPTNSIQLNGSGTDSDGSIVSYTWTQFGGPAAEIKGANTATPTITVSNSGNHYFRLTVKDDDGATHADNMLLAVTGELVSVNEAPVASAGPDRTLALPINSLTLNGSGTDSDGSIVSYTWTQFGGPAADIEGANTATPTITVFSSGNHYFRLIVQDNDGATHADNMLLSVTGELVTVNSQPVAYAGPDRTITLPVNAIILNGSGTDSDGSIVSYSWSQDGGPTAEISGAQTATPTITVSGSGNYYFRLTVKDDDGATHDDSMLLSVKGEVVTVNTQPVANAGPDRIITPPSSSITLHGSGTDKDGSIAAYEWTQYGGGETIMSGSNSNTLMITGLKPGSYYFRLTVEDNGGATDFDEVMVTVLDQARLPVTGGVRTIK